MTTFGSVPKRRAPESALGTATGFERFFSLVRQVGIDLFQSRHLAREMFVREIARQYRSSLLGVFLAFFPAIVIAGWATMVRHAKIITLPPDMDLPYAPFVLINLMLWQTFVESLYAPVSGLKSELPTLARSTMPGECVVLAKLAEVSFNFLIKLVLILAAIWWYDIPMTPWAGFAPVGVLLLIMLGTGIGLILAPLNVFYQDISAALAPVTLFWLFLTPVIVPVPREGWASIVVIVNPVTPLLVTTRELLTTAQLTQPIGFALMCVVSIAVFFLGLIFFRLTLPLVIDRSNT